MITEHADLKALTVKDIHTASDGTRKVVFSVAVMLWSDLLDMIDFWTQDVTDTVLSWRWFSDWNSYHSLR
jgi:hypothetical protein